MTTLKLTCSQRCCPLSRSRPGYPNPKLLLRRTSRLGTSDVFFDDTMVQQEHECLSRPVFGNVTQFTETIQRIIC
jgi:hypothetical protein